MDFVAIGLINCIPIFLIRKWLHPQSFSRFRATLISLIYAIFVSILFQLAGSHGQSPYMWAILNIYILTTSRLQPVQNTAEPNVFSHQCEKCGKSFSSTNWFDRWCENCKHEYFHSLTESQPNSASADNRSNPQEDKLFDVNESQENISCQKRDSIAISHASNVLNSPPPESPKAVPNLSEIRFCRYCGNKLRNDSKYCDKCGKKVR